MLSFKEAVEKFGEDAVNAAFAAAHGESAVVSDGEKILVVPAVGGTIVATCYTRIEMRDTFADRVAAI